MRASEKSEALIFLETILRMNQNIIGGFKVGTIFIQPDTNMATIQKALDTPNTTVAFCPGVHKIKQPLYIGSQVKLKGIEGHKLQQGSRGVNHMLMTRTYKNTVGYNGMSDIIIDGLVIEGMGGTYGNNLNLLTLWHAKNVEIRNTTFLDACGFHALEINGCKHIIIQDSKFLGYKSNPKQDFREQIQIDYASTSALFLHATGSKCYDNTTCSDILIRRCEFGASVNRPGASSCIGNHGQPYRAAPHNNITIEDCVFRGNGTNPKDSCIKLIGMNNVVVQRNIAKGFGRFVYAYRKNYSYKSTGESVDACECDGKCINISYLNNNKVYEPTAGYKSYKYYNAIGKE